MCKGWNLKPASEYLVEGGGHQEQASQGDIDERSVSLKRQSVSWKQRSVSGKEWSVSVKQKDVCLECVYRKRVCPACVSRQRTCTVKSCIVDIWKEEGGMGRRLLRLTWTRRVCLGGVRVCLGRTGVCMGTSGMCL